MRRLALLSMLALSGCASINTFVNGTDYSMADPKTVAHAVTIQDSEFDASVTYNGPRMRDGMHSWMLRSWREKKGGRAFNHQLYMDLQYTDDWRFYLSASSPGGERIPLTEIDRQVVNCSAYGCTLKELVSVQMTDEALRGAKSGFALRLNSKRGQDFVVHVSSNYIAGYLSALPKPEAKK